MENVSVLLGNNIIETLNFENPVCNSYILGLSAKTKLLTLNDDGSKTIIVYSEDISSNLEQKKYYTCEPVEQVVTSGNEDKRFEKYEVYLDCYKKDEDVLNKNQENQDKHIANTHHKFTLENGVVYGIFRDLDSIKIIKIRIRLFDKKNLLGQAEVDLLLGTNKMIFDVTLDFDLKNLYFSNRENKTIKKLLLSSLNTKGKKEISISNNDTLFTDYLQKAFEVINEENKKPDSKAHCLVSIHIVMPNNYGCDKLIQEIPKTQKYHDILKDPNSTSIIGFDVSVLYESDVSFADVFSENIKGHYLIIDWRKNDLDFSAINFTSNHVRIEHLYRDSIIGAGNALSYAMLLVLLRGFINAETPGIKPEKSEPLIKKFIFEKILGTKDTELLEELMQLLDQYKAKYYGLKERVPIASLSLGNEFLNLSLKELVQKIKYFVDNNLYIDDLGEYMNRMMDSLAESVWERINNWLVLGYSPTSPQIITTGLEPFLSPFRKMVAERLEAILCCPKKDGDVKETNKKEIEPTTPPSQKKSIINTIIKPKPITKSPKKIIIKQPKEDNLMNLMSYDDQFQIAYFRYPLPPDLQKTRPFDIFFIEGEIWINEGNNFSNYETSKGVNNHVFEAEFPYHQVSNSKDVVIPPANK